MEGGNINKNMISQPLFGLSDTQQMMFAFGDSRRPNIETAKIMETVVLKQISEILHKAAKVSQMSSKGSKTIQIESILFMMKNSPIKIQRLIKYLSAKEFTRKASNDADGEVEENSKKKSITTRCKEFLESIDDTGILLSACSEEYFDEIYMERLLKNDRITRNMDEKRYQEYCKARTVGFRGSYSVKFQNSLEEVITCLDLKVEKVCQEVLSYLAYETLGQLIEMCLILRRDTCRDDISRHVPARAVNPEYPSIFFPSNSSSGSGSGEAKAEQLPGHPVTPAEIREVVRRLQQTSYNGRPISRGTRCRPVSSMPLLAI